MKSIYKIILISTIAVIPVLSGYAIDPDSMDLPEETWEFHYNDYRSLWDDAPVYKDISHTVTVKRDGRRIYIRGIFAECPDAWISGTYEYELLRFDYNQELLTAEGTPVYFYPGHASFVSSSDNDLEYTMGASMEFYKNIRWRLADDDANRDLLLPKFEDTSIWINSRQEDSLSILRTYHYDTPPTGDDFGSRPIYLYPTFRIAGQSNTVSVETEQTIDNRVFDLNGRQVDPDHLAPGIYIRNGKKFVISR